VNTVVDVVPSCPVAVMPPSTDIQIQISPNPVDGLLRIRIPHDAAAVQIVNLLGQSTWQQPPAALPSSTDGTAHEFLLDVSSWPAGLYFVTTSGQTKCLQVLHH
jgi:hypothetical protein